jgi:hypothetical protein
MTIEAQSLSRSIRRIGVVKSYARNSEIIREGDPPNGVLSGSQVGHQVEKRYEARFDRAVGEARELPSSLLGSPIESILRPWRDILRPVSAQI